MRLSKNFHSSEFTDRDINILTIIQIYMLKHLTNNILEPIREYLTKVNKSTVRIKVTSGIRFPSDYNRLRKEGYFPSEVSDHFYNNIIKLRSPLKIKQYGKYYQYSVGAADILPECGVIEAYKILKPFFNRKNRSIDLPGKKIEIGQFIIEKKNNYWIHLSNPKTLIYQDFMVNTFFKNEPFLKRIDGGKNYKLID